MASPSFGALPAMLGRRPHGEERRNDDALLDNWVSLNAHVARLTHTTAVTHVDISHVMFSTSEWQWLCLVLGQTTSLRALTLEGNGLTDAHVAALLVDPPASSTRSHAAVASRHHHLAALETLSLAHNRMTYRSMTTVYKFVLWRTAHLVALDVSENPIGDHGAHVLCIGLAKQNADEIASGGSSSALFPRALLHLLHRRPTKQQPHARGWVPLGLAFLKMRSCRLSLRGIKDVLFAAGAMSGLTHLDLGENDVVRSLCEGRHTQPLTSFPELPRHSNLRTLLLPSCNVGSQVTPAAAHQMLLSLMLSCDRLGEVILDHAHDDAASLGGGWDSTRVADVLAELLFQVAEDSLQRSRAFPAALSSLHTISLEASGLSDDGAKAFAYAVWNRPSDAFLAHLVRLNVRRNYLSVDGVLDVLEVMEHLARCRAQSGIKGTSGGSAAEATEGGRFVLFAEENELVASMREVDALYDGAVEMLYNSADGNATGEGGMFTFGPRDATHRSRQLSAERRSPPRTVVGYTCQEYCEVVRCQIWPYRRQDTAAVHAPSMSPAPSPESRSQRNPRPLSSSANTLFHTPADLSVIPKAPATSFYDEDGTSPIRHPFLESTDPSPAAGASPRHASMDAASVPSVLGSRSPTASPHRPQSPGLALGAASSPRGDHSTDRRPQLHRAGPLVSPPRDDDESNGVVVSADPLPPHHHHTHDSVPPDGGALAEALDVHEAHDPSPARNQQATTPRDDAFPHHQPLCIEELPDNEDAFEAPQLHAATAANTYMAQRQSPIRRQTAFVEQTSKYNDGDPTSAAATLTRETTAADMEGDNSSVLVITAADKVAARKARLAANRLRRRKLLASGGDDDEQQGADILDGAAHQVATPTVDDAVEPTIAAPLPTDPSVHSDNVSPGHTHGEQRTAEAPEGATIPISSPSAAGQPPSQRLPPLLLPQRIERDPSGLKGRVKTFTLTYTHPPGHIICRMWHLLVGSATCGGGHADPATRRWLQDAATAALTQDLCDRLQPDAEDMAHCVELVTLAINADALAVDVTVVTNEKRTTIAQRLQDAAALGDTAAGEEGDFLDGGVLPAEGTASAAFPRCCRLLLGFAEDGAPLSDTPQGQRMLLDIVAHAATCLGDTAAAAERPPELNGYHNVHEWVHLLHGREDELLATLPATGSLIAPDDAAAAQGALSPTTLLDGHEGVDVVSHAPTEIFAEDTEPLVATPVVDRSPLKHRFDAVATDAELGNEAEGGDDAGAAAADRHDAQPSLEASPNASLEQDDVSGSPLQQTTASDANALHGTPLDDESKDATARGLALMPSDLPWALPTTLSDLDDTLCRPDTYVRWSGDLRMCPTVAPHTDDQAQAFGRLLQRLHGDGRACPGSTVGSGILCGVEQRQQQHLIITNGAAQEDALPPSRSATPPPPSGPASPNRLVAATNPAAAASFQAIHHLSDDDDNGNVVGPDESIGDVVQRRAATEPRLSFLRRTRSNTTPTNDSPFRRSSTATPTHRASAIGMDADANALFHTQWRQEAEALLRRSTALGIGPQDPSVSVALVERRLKNIARVCSSAVANGAVPLSASVRNKVRVCQGKIDASAFAALLASLAEARHDDGQHPLEGHSPGRKPSSVRVTLSVEWDGLLVLKHDDGHGKRLLHVHPLAHGVDAAAGGEGADVGKGKELILQLQRPGLTDAEEQDVARHVSNAALRGKVSLSPSAPAAAFVRAAAHRLTLCIQLDSAKKVSKAILLLNECVTKAMLMVLVASAKAAEGGGEGDDRNNGPRHED